MLIPEDTKIYLYAEPTDMRKSIDTLCNMVSEVLKMDPISGDLFLFRNRLGNKLKALYYELNCFTLWYRRLEKPSPMIFLLKKKFVVVGKYWFALEKKSANN